MGKIIAARKEGKEEAGNAARKENEEGLHSTPPVRVRVCASRQQGQLPRRSRHPVRHSGRLSLSADNVLTSSFFFQNYSFQRGGSAERMGAAEAKTLSSSRSHGFKSMEFIKKLCHTVCARTSLVYSLAQGSKQRRFAGRKLGIFPPVRPTSAQLGI